jgi:hypothetical protein
VIATLVVAILAGIVTARRSRAAVPAVNAAAPHEQ